MAKNTASISAATTGKHSVTPPSADRFAGTLGKRGVAAASPSRQALGTGTQAAWKSKLPLPIRKASGRGAAGKGTASLSNLSLPPLHRISGRDASKLPIPTRKTPGGASATSRLPIPSPKTPKNATGTPQKATGTTKVPLAPRQIPRAGVTSPTAPEGNKNFQQKTKAKSPSSKNTTRTANDTTRGLAGSQISVPPKPKIPSVTLRRPSLSPTKIHYTTRIAAAPQRQNRPQPLPNLALVTPVTTPIVAVPITPVVPPRVLVPLPSTYNRVKVCEGECLKPLPTDLQKVAGAIYLQRHRHKFAPQPGCPQLRAKLVVAAGSHYKQKPLLGASPIKQCLSEEEVVTRSMKGKVVAPHLGPGGRPCIWKDFNKVPIAIRMHFHRKILMEGTRWSPWGPYPRELAYGEQ